MNLLDYLFPTIVVGVLVLGIARVCWRRCQLARAARQSGYTQLADGMCEEILEGPIGTARLFSWTRSGEVPCKNILGDWEAFRDGVRTRLFELKFIINDGDSTIYWQQTVVAIHRPDHSVPQRRRKGIWTVEAAGEWVIAYQFNVEASPKTLAEFVRDATAAILAADGPECP